MFQNWGFLLGEIWVLILLAALLGLLVGWIIWGRRETVNDRSDEIRDLQAQLAACKAAHDEKDARILAIGTPVPVATEAPAATADRDFDGDGVIEGQDEGVKPAALSSAREGGADDLKLIKGIGPKLEKLCNTLGFYHFDQIASWTEDEIAWVDANLLGFKGRVSRDEWVSQAKVLSEGDSTEFANRVKDGDVY